MNNLFDKMSDPESKKRFLIYKGSGKIPDFRIQQMSEYLSSSKYEEDVQKLANGDFSISIPRKKMIPKSYTDRKRTVYHFEEDEMTLFRMMAFLLHDYDDIISENVYSFRRNISAKDLVLKIRQNKSLANVFVVKADLINYGNSINSNYLSEILENSLGARDPKAVRFFRWLLDRHLYVLNENITAGDTSAIPGCPIHNFFTNIYLEDILSERSVLYARYSDDIILFVKSREEAEENLSLLMKEFKRLGLKPHADDKTAIYEPGEAFDFLGFKFQGQEVDIARSSVRKLKRRMRIRAKRLDRDKKGLYSTPEEKAKNLIRLNHYNFYGKPNSSDLSWSRWAFPIITKTDSLHELDLYSQRCIRFLLSGKWSDCQYRISYDKLKELGYNSLVRAYYREKEEQCR